MDFKSLKDLEKYLQQQVNKSLEKNVTPVVKKIMIEQIEDTVYSAYSPSEYKRRGQDEGLADPENIGGVMVGNTLEIINATAANPDIYIHGVKYESINADDYLTPIIEYGQGYEFHSDDGDSGYEQPRPFIENSRETLRQTKVHVKALKKGLRESGIKVE